APERPSSSRPALDARPRHAPVENRRPPHPRLLHRWQPTAPEETQRDSQVLTSAAGGEFHKPGGPEPAAVTFHRSCDKAHVVSTDASGVRDLYPTERNFSLKFTACFLLGTFACLYLNLFVPPFTPICLGEDEGNWLLDAMRMLRGQVIYRDFFQFTAPGTQWVYFVLFVWLGPRTWVPNVLLILLGLGLVWLSVVISKRVMRGSAVFLPGLLFLTLAFRRAFAVTHHWWNELAVMGSIAVVI